MKERFVVVTEHKSNPEFEAVVWFEKREDAIREAQRRREFYFKETTYMLKVLNIPSVASKKYSEGTK